MEKERVGSFNNPIWSAQHERATIKEISSSSFHLFVAIPSWIFVPVSIFSTIFFHHSPYFHKHSTAQKNVCRKQNSSRRSYEAWSRDANSLTRFAGSFCFSLEFIGSRRWPRRDETKFRDRVHNSWNNAYGSNSVDIERIAERTILIRSTWRLCLFQFLFSFGLFDYAKWSSAKESLSDPREIIPPVKEKRFPRLSRNVRLLCAPPSSRNNTALARAAARVSTFSPWKCLGYVRRAAAMYEISINTRKIRESRSQRADYSFVPRHFPSASLLSFPLSTPLSSVRPKRNHETSKMQR